MNILDQLMPKNHLKTCAVIIACITLISATSILATAPTQTLSEQVEKVLSVSVIEVLPQDFTPYYQAFGQIESPQLLSLTAQVEGEISFINKAFIEGGWLRKGDIVFQIDNSDYLHKLKQRKSELKITQANLQLEIGEQKVAENNYQQIRDDFSKENLLLQKSLMLRTPQLETAKANVTIAQSNVNLAETNLQRTKVISNADYVVLSKTIYHGSFVNKGDNLGELAQLATLRVSLAVPSHVAAMLRVNQVVEVSGNSNKKHQALVSHISPSLYANSQLQQVYLSIENQQQSFILGEFISASLALTKQENTLKVPLSAIDNGSLWLVNQNNRLSTKPASIIWQDKDYALIKNTLTQGEFIVTSKVSGARVGMITNIVSGVL